MSEGIESAIARRVAGELRGGEAESALAIFDPGRLQAELDRDLPGALRALADAIETKDLDVRGNRLEGWGFQADPRDQRAHFRVTLALAVPVRKVLAVGDLVKSEGE